jgi:hypothetical protein
MPNDLQLDSDRVVTVEGAPASRVKTRTERYRRNAGGPPRSSA